MASILSRPQCVKQRLAEPELISNNMDMKNMGGKSVNEPLEPEGFINNIALSRIWISILRKFCFW